MSSDFVYNSEYNKVMSGGYMIGSRLFNDNMDTKNIINYNKNLAVPIGLLNYRGGGNKTQLFEQTVETEISGIHSGMVGGSVFDGLIKQLDPSYKTPNKSNTSSKTNKRTKKTEPVTKKRNISNKKRK
jgi:hypothetical protein